VASLTDRDKRLTLVAAIMGSFIVLLDSTVVNVALPAIRAELGGGLSGQQWVVNAYLLFLGSLILIGGSLGDVFGAKRVFAVGVAGFGAVSALCALAPSIEVLVAGRALQGVFGALLTPASLAIIIATFTDSERGSAIGTWTAYTGIAAVVGPVLGGQLVDALSWRWIFAVNVPFVIVTLLVAARMPAVQRSGPRRRPDGVGATLCAVGLAGPTFGLVRQPDAGWGSPQVILPIVLGLAVFAAFLAWERRARDPMLPLGLFARGNFRWGNVETLCVYGGLGMLLFVLVLFLQQVGDFSATEAGLALLPVTVVMFGLSRRSGALADRLGPRLFMGVGPLLAATGVVLQLMLIDEDPSFWSEVVPGVTVFALGLVTTVAPLTAAVLADAETRHAGIASGVNNAVARVAGLLAVASVGAVVGGTVDIGGFRTGMAFAAGLLAAGGVVGLVFVRNERDRDDAPRSERERIRAEDCAGGQFAGAPGDGAVTPRAPALSAAARG
jgi:EmrB/QacA subfamily drug resistance transporter